MKGIVMLGTRMDSLGGMASVVSVYRDSGFLQRHCIGYLATHCDGRRARKLAVVVRTVLIYTALLLRCQVALVHAHAAQRASFWRKAVFVMLAFLFRVPTILHVHGSEFTVFHDQECGPRRRALIRWVFDRCDRILVLSVTRQAWVQGMCSNPEIIVLYNPVEIPTLSATAQTDRLYLLFLGRYGQRKGAFDLVQAFALVAARNPHVELLMGGDGEVDAVLALACRLGISDRVRCLGWIRGAEKQRLLSQARAFVLPSYHEGLPMAILEAMAQGLPVVSTPVGGIPEAVRDGIEGFLVTPGDVPALAERLLQLVQDETLARRMGAAARRRAESEFSTTAVLPRLESIYAGLGVTV
jgi:glycosyltransferase involved in cell wall biosynthesis